MSEAKPPSRLRLLRTAGGDATPHARLRTNPAVVNAFSYPRQVDGRSARVLALGSPRDSRPRLRSRFRQSRSARAARAAGIRISAEIAHSIRRESGARPRGAAGHRGSARPRESARLFSLAQTFFGPLMTAAARAVSKLGNARSSSEPVTLLRGLARGGLPSRLGDPPAKFGRRLSPRTRPAVGLFLSALLPAAGRR